MNASQTQPRITQSTGKAADRTLPERQPETPISPLPRHVAIIMDGNGR